MPEHWVDAIDRDRNAGVGLACELAHAITGSDADAPLTCTHEGDAGKAASRLSRVLLISAPGVITS